MTDFKNPFVGPRPLKRDELLFGRDREVRHLKALLISERIVVLHSPSGAGKTSMVQAGLLPFLGDKEFLYFPIIRLNRTLGDENKSSSSNRYVISMLMSLEEELPAEYRLPTERLCDLEIKGYLDNRFRPDEAPESELLIFDQFEEILTIGFGDLIKKQHFFKQLGEALENNKRWAIFIIREDFLGALAPFKRFIPGNLSCTFRLDLLDREGARQAIQKPALHAVVDISDEVVQKLVDDLSEIKIQSATESTPEYVTGQYIEPVQLQVVCYRLWEERPKDSKVIGINDLNKFGNVDESLADYYQATINSVVKQSGVNERKLREWIENRLILPNGFRGQVPMDQIESGGLNNNAIFLLINAHIVRSENRLNRTWFELSHDRLITPIHQNNELWFKANLSLLQKQAAIWKEEKHPKGMLLRDRELKLALEWASLHKDELTDVEKQYLDNCLISQEAEDRRKRTMLGLSIGIIVTLALALFAFIQRQEMEKQKQNALSRLLLTKVQTIDTRESKMQIPRLALSLEAYGRLSDEPSYSNLWSSVSAFRAGDLHFMAEGKVLSACVSFASKKLVTRSDEGIIQAWDLTKDSTQLPLTISLDSDSDSADIASKVLCSSGGENIIADLQSYGSSKIAFWNLKTGTQIMVIETNDYISDFSISPDNNWVVTGSRDGKVTLWDSSTGLEREHIFDDEGIIKVIFRPDGNQIASVNNEGDLVIWDLVEQKVKRVETGSPQDVITYNPDSKLLVLGGNDGKIFILNASNGEIIDTLYHNQGINSLDFSFNGNFLLSASKDGVYKIWNTEKTPFIEAVEGIYYGPIYSADFSLEGNSFLIGGLSGYTDVYQLGKIDMSGQAKKIARITRVFSEGPVDKVGFIEGENKIFSITEEGQIIISDIIEFVKHDLQVVSIEFSKNGQFLSTSSMDRTAKVWNISAGTVQYEFHHEDQVIRAAFSPDSNYIATASYDKTAKVWSLADGKEVVSINHNDKVSDVSFTYDGAYLGTAGWDGMVQIWDMRSKKNILTYFHDQKVNRILFDSRTGWVATASDDRTIQIWDYKVGEISTTINLDAPVTDIGFVPSEDKIISGDLSGNIVIWNVKDGKSTLSKKMGSRPIYKVGISVDGSYFAAGDESGKLCTWRVDSGKEEGCFFAGNSIWDLVISSSNMLFVGSLDGYIYIWDIKSNSMYMKIGYPGMVTSIDLSPDNKFLAVSTTSGSLGMTIWKKEDIIPLACRSLPRQLSEREWQLWEEFLGKYDPYCIKNDHN